METPVSERTPVISISLADPRLPELTAMIRELDRQMEALNPAESDHLVDIDTLAQVAVTMGVSDSRHICAARRSTSRSAKR